MYVNKLCKQALTNTSFEKKHFFQKMYFFVWDRNNKAQRSDENEENTEF